MKTIYKINTSTDQFVALDKAGLAAHVTAMIGSGWPADYTVPIVSSPGKMVDDNYALEVSVPEAIHAELVRLAPAKWASVDLVADSMGYDLANDSNKSGSWNYRFEKSE